MPKRVCLLLSLSGLLLLSGIPAQAQRQTYTSATDARFFFSHPKFKTALRKLSSVKTVSSKKVGFGGTPGEFYILSKECLAYGKETDFIALSDDDNPVMRAMGLVCLAQLDDERYRGLLNSHLDDREEAVLAVGCIIGRVTIGEIVKRLIENPNFLEQE